KSLMNASLPPLNALRAFEAVARLGSVKHAGIELNVTHGAISRQLKSLEEALGIALLEKEGRGVKLTDSGIRLRAAAGEAFERLRSTCAELQRQTAEAPFVLRSEERRVGNECSARRARTASQDR